MKKKIKEAHKHADIALFEANVARAKKEAMAWLNADVDGIKKWHMLLLLSFPIYNVLSFILS